MTEQQLVDALTALKPLSKPHYGSHLMNTGLLDPTRLPLLTQYVRLTGHFPVSLDYISQAQIDLGVTLGKQLGTSICVNTTPWASAEFNSAIRADSWGPEVSKDLGKFAANLAKTKSMIDATNAAKGASVKVSNISVDVECWNRKTDSEDHINSKWNVIFSLINEFFPGVSTVIYARGGVNYDNNTGWSNNEYGFSTLTEQGDYYSPDLYFMSEVSLMEEVLRRNMARAAEKGWSKVIPWVALGGSGYRDKINIIQWTSDAKTRPVTPYPVDSSFRLGFEIHQKWAWQFPERFVDGAKIPAVCFWPAPFDPMVPEYGKHFLAYCQGANNAPLVIPS